MPDRSPDRHRIGAGSLPDRPCGGFCVLSFEPPLEPFSSESLLGNDAPTYKRRWESHENGSQKLNQNDEFCRERRNSPRCRYERKFIAPVFYCHQLSPSQSSRTPFSPKLPASYKCSHHKKNQKRFLFGGGAATTRRAGHFGPIEIQTGQNGFTRWTNPKLKSKKYGFTKRPK